VQDGNWTSIRGALKAKKKVTEKGNHCVHLAEKKEKIKRGKQESIMRMFNRTFDKERYHQKGQGQWGSGKKQHKTLGKIMKEKSRINGGDGRRGGKQKGKKCYTFVERKRGNSIVKVEQQMPWKVRRKKVEKHDGAYK